jgi:hypothetical protein
MNTGLLSNSQNPFVISSNLLAYYSFNDGSGSIARDFSFNKRDGILSGSALPTWNIGTAGGGLRFNGTSSTAGTPSLLTSSFVECPLITNAVTNVSLCAWFKSDIPTKSGQTIIHNGSDNAGTGYGFALNNESTTNGHILILFAAYAWYDTGVAVTDSNWHFGVMTLDGTGVQRYYHDGIIKYTGSGGSKHAPTVYTEIGRDDFIIGNPTYPRYFGGSIDEVRVYSKALNASEVWALYKAI